MRLTIVLVVMIVLLSGSKSFSQSDGATTQFWWDAVYYRPFQTNFRKILVVGTRHLLSGSDPWSKLFIRPSLEWYPVPFVDVIAELVYMRTNETKGLNSVELRPDIGFRLNFLQERLVFRTNTRLEYRYFRYKEIGTDLSTVRFRSRLELVVPINNKSYRDPKTLYGLTDFEVFADLAGDEVVERFHNQNRFRLGLGWRFDLEWRIELFYTKQSSRSTLQQDFDTSDNIFRVRIKFQPLRSNPTKELKDQPQL